MKSIRASTTTSIPRHWERTFRYFVQVGVGTAVLFGALWIAWDAVAVGITLWGVGAAIAAAYRLRHRLGRRAAGNLAIAVATLALVLVVAVSGGITGSRAEWLVTPPLMAGLLLGRRDAILWGIGTVAVALLLWGLHAEGVPFPDLVPAEHRLMDAILSYISALVVAFLLSVFYAMAQERAIVATRRSNRKLRKQTEALRRANAELRESQKRLMLSEKMAALGRLTAGIAHEINSPLGGVMNSLEMARSYVEEYERSLGDPEVTEADHRAIARDLKDAVRLAEGATNKAVQFVRAIKGQTHMGAGDERVFDPAAEVESTLLLLRHLLRERRVELRTELEPGLQLTGSPAKFGVVVQNLVTNAADAYEERGGEVHLRLRRDGGSILLEVEDFGSGIAEEIRSHIFDYLFTTKAVGKGTGLGLAITHGIVTSHFGGEIGLRSRVGRGTTFTIRFPRGGAE